MGAMDFWIFTHNSDSLEHWFERYQDRFDAWEKGGVTGIVVGYLRFADGEPVFAPDPQVYHDHGETPPEVPHRNPEKEKQLQAMLDDAAGRGWQIMTFGGSTSPASLQDLANGLPQVNGVIVDGPGENHYELAFHHHGELLEIRPGQEGQFEAAGADLARVRRGMDHLRKRLHNLTPNMVRYQAPGGTLAGLQLFDINEDVLHWLRARQEMSRQGWEGQRKSIDQVDRKLLLGGIPRTASFSSLTGQNYQQMPQYYDYILPKHYYWHRGFDGLYGTVARWVQRLRKWSPSLTEADCLLVVANLLGIELPGVANLMDMEHGFPKEFYDEFVFSESKRALEAVGDPDRVVFWVSTGRAPHSGDPMSARDLHGILSASERAGARHFLFHPDPYINTAEWRILSSLCGEEWIEDTAADFWIGDKAEPDFYSGNMKPPAQD